MRARYDTYLPALYLWDGENLRILLTGKVLPTLHGHFICNNWHLCGVCWEDCERKNSHVPTPSEVVTAIAGLIKHPGGFGMSSCSLAAAGRPLGLTELNLQR